MKAKWLPAQQIHRPGHRQVRWWPLKAEGRHGARYRSIYRDSGAGCLTYELGA